MTHEDIQQLIDEFQTITQNASEEFGKLNHDQLNWKPAPDNWSIGQVFDHLITSNSTYFSGFEAIIAGNKKKTFWESLPFLPGIWGGWLVKSMLPGKGKFKSPKVFRPSESDVPSAIIQNFLENQDRLITYIEQLKDIDHEKVIVTSPVSPIITYSLKDTFQILLNHEKRHHRQAQKTKELAAFPISEG